MIMDTSTNTTEQRKIVDEALTSVYDQLYINALKVCTYNFSQWGSDLVAYVVSYFLNLPLKKQYEVVVTPSAKVSSLERYLTSAMSLAIRSSTSPFYTKYRKPMEKSRELFPDYDYSHIIGYDVVDGDDWWNKMKDSLPALIKQLHFYDRYIIQKHYLEQLTIQEIHEITNITTYRLSRDIKIALIHLKELIKENK